MSPDQITPEILAQLQAKLLAILPADGSTMGNGSAAKRWVDAVNNWGRLGTWHYALTLDINEIPAILLEAAAKEVKPPRGG